MKKILQITLYPLSLIYYSITYLRNKLYDWGIFASHEFKFPILSIGNLSLGGTGKTPHTEYLVRLLKDKYNIATLSRGYKRKTKGFYSATKNSSYKDIGDEPLQYKSKFKNLTVAVDEKRVRGVSKILQGQPQTEVIILDDAYQHRSISPGLNILITEYNNLYTDDCIFPSGRLRESKNGSKRAGIIIISKTPKDISKNEIRIVLQKINPLNQQKVFFTTINYKELTPFTEKAKELNTTLKKEQTILLVTGIAKPNPLLQSLKNEYRNVHHIQFPDHHNFTSKDIKKIKNTFNQIEENNKFIISTEKDIMRLSLPEILKDIQDIPIFYIPIEVSFLDDERKEFDNLITEYVRKNKRNN
ncbi:MAG: tetraacyldisaccharide 4'-kinase [Vicingaceae bacterium]